MAAIGASRVGGSLIDGLTYILVARYLGPSDYGHYLALLAFLNLIDLAADMTVLDITVREMSKDPEATGTWLATSSVLRLGLASAGFLAYVAYVYLGRAAPTPELLTTAWIASLVLPVGALRMPLAVFRARMKMQFELGVILVTRLVNLTLFLVLIHYHGRLYQFFLATFLSRLLLAILVWGAALIWLRVRLSFRGPIFRRLLQESLPMGLSGFFVALQLKLDILMVAAISGAVAAGLYGVVAQLPEYSLVIPTIVTTPLLPVLSRSLGENGQDHFQRVYQGLFDGIFAIVTPICVVTLIMPRETVTLLFGQRFADASPVLPLLILSMVFMWLSHAIAIAAVAAGVQRSFIWIQTVCVASYLLFNWILIPRWGIRGAATARLVGTMIAPFLTYYVVKKHRGFRLHTLGIRSSILAGLAMAAAVFLVSPYPLVLAGAVGTVVYAATLWGIRSVPQLEF